MLKCVLVSIAQKLTEENVTEIYLESTLGHFGVLPQHLPIIVKLKDDSLIRLKREIGELKFHVGPHSFFKFKDGQGMVLTDDFQKVLEY